MDYCSMKNAPYVDELVVDNAEDLDKIPVKSYSPGTTCLVISDSKVYILKIDKTWQLM